MYMAKKQNIAGAYALVMGIFAHQRLNGDPMTIRGDGEQNVILLTLEM